MVNRIETQILSVYEYAKDFVNHRGYGEYINTLSELLEKQPYKTISRADFLREYTWVVFTCGFKADTVRKYWGEIKRMLFNFNQEKIKNLSFEELLHRCPIKNKRKISAIHKTCQSLDKEYIKKIKTLTSEKEAKRLFKSLPFIGDITVFHIMRNLGIDCYKPDRHIKNLAQELDMPMEDIFDIINVHSDEEYIGLIDHILWRACADLGSAETLVEYAMDDYEISRSISKRNEKNSKPIDFLF